jgi:hypothetical protein
MSLLLSFQYCVINFNYKITEWQGMLLKTKNPAVILKVSKKSQTQPNGELVQDGSQEQKVVSKGNPQARTCCSDRKDLGLIRPNHRYLIYTR